MLTFSRKEKKQNLYREIPILQIGKSNGAGNIYTEKSVNKILEVFSNKGSLMGELVSDYTKDGNYVTTLSNVTHVIKHLFVEDGFLVAVVKFMDHQKGKDAIKILGEGLAILRPTISGTVDSETHEIRVNNVMSVDLLPVEERLIEKNIDWIKIR